MLVNLINTILIACGMAVNTTNFNSVEKPYRRNAESGRVEIYIEKNLVEKGTVFTWRDSTTNYAVRKYLMDNNDEPNYYGNSYLAVTNTTYTRLSNDDSQNGYMYKYLQVGIFQITNYYNSSISLDLQNNLKVDNDNGNTSGNVSSTYVYNGPAGIYIDMTLNQYTMDNAMELMNQATLIETISNTVPNSANIEDQTITNQTLQPSETKTYIFFKYRSNGNAYFTTDAKPVKMSISGSAYVPIVNTEVVNIPELMFTVLTLPFSFISQGFNLTIFPGTPYQINFTNLFLTVIAIFILLWLIKHIFK